jgi:23S rRNA pseudouridine1911/1915/1917 synthase
MRLHVPDDAAGRRLDSFLAELHQIGSRAVAERLLGTGGVLVDGRVRLKSHKLVGGEEIEFEPPTAPKSTLEPEAMDLSVPYEDEHLLIVDKPAGLVVHPAPGHAQGTLVHGLLAHDVEGGDEPDRPGIVHRLDRDTSGVLLVAKTDRAHQLLSRQMRKRTIRKEYLAVVAGVPRVRKGEVSFAIGRDPRDRKKMKALKPSDTLPAGAREARTLYEIERDWFPLGLALLRCRLVTGRTHQIRVHLAASGLPIVGDPVYGRPRYPRLRDATLKKVLTEFPRQALHAERVAFHHPVSQELIEIVAPLPPDLAGLLEQIQAAAE